MKAEPGKEDIEQQIRDLIENHLNAMQTKDAEGIVANYTDDNVMFTLAPPLMFTPENGPGIEGVEKWLAGWDGPLKYEVRELEVNAGDDIAFSHSLNRMTGTKTDGAKVDMWFRKTLCFVRDTDGWKIAHDHESVPFYMDGSLKAAVDLKP